MHSKYLQFLLLRVLFPATLLITIAMRPYGMSVVYVLLLILSPPFPIKTANNARLLQVTTGISICLLIVHLIWHIILAVFVPYASILKSYPHARIIGHNLGLVSYKHNISVVKATFYMAPEIFLSSSSLTLLFLLKRITHISRAKKFQTHPFLTACGKYVVLLLIMCSGILNPNMISSIYFLVFLILGTWWALNKSLVKVLAVIGRCLMPILALHTLLLLLYQCTWALENFPPDDGLARFLGLIKIAHIDVFSPEETWYEGPRTGRSEHRFTMYATPLVMLLTYYCLGLETSELFKPKVKIVTGLEGGTKGNGAMVPGVSFMKPKEKWASTTNKVAIPFISSKVLRGTRSETTPFTRNTSLSKHTKWASISRQISTGSIIIDQESVRQSNTVVAEIGRTVIDFFQITIRSSYIATTIIMMAWSIMYHSWLTFVLLMWANFVWLTPNQRSTMLRSSPILVVYAIGLLIIQYLYSMNLSESELPSTSGVEGINFKQIGMIRMATEAPFKPLLIKCLFMCMFWITLKQWMQERKGMPPRLSTTEWGEALEMPSTVGSEREKSRLFQKLGTFLRHMCVRYWIYVVAIMLFVIGITGERMTIFRIIYMFLFLVFILLFQISWYLWRLMMYVFWIVLIFYSMIYLILTYIYQFDEFSNLIEKYLYIDKKLQRDLGLDAYDRADLFLKLLTPTSFLIITIIQVHYFHKDFMAYSDPKTYHKRDSKIDTLTGPSQDASTMKDDIPQLPLEGGRGVSPTADRRSIRSLTPEASKYSQSYTGTSRRQSLTFRAWVLLKFINFKKYVKVIFDLTIAYLELHMIKIIFVSLMLLCAFDVCALHVPIMLVICPGLWMHSRNQRGWVLVMSTLISIYLMVRMVYQINYIDPTSFLTTCDSVPYNNAHWVGFKKLAKGENLSSLLKGYIGLIAVFIVHSLILYRHDSYKGQIGVATVSKVMFPNIRREDADKNMITCIKYLTNYGFYKFGVEITLICMMGVIGSRMDMYALIYAFWLLTLVTMHRRQQARVWRVFTSYITLIIPVQYCLAVGVLPYFCIKYPWDGNSDKLKQIRSFLYLPHADDPPHGVKLIFDYFLLLFASLQLKVFRREELYGESYAGGSNSEIIGQHWETPNFVNPIPDFTGFVGTWLDVTKRVIFLGMLWVTLAIMFMTGTNRVNLFSMGYLIGSFIFLWQGTDFYLLPKKVILAWWSWLLRYNVTVVVIKTLLQIAGCIYGSVLQAHACWLVQLLGIGCVDKFAGHSLSKFLKMDYIKNEVCSVPQEDIGLAWDGVCFAFLILQKRMFYSYYFYRVIDESKATTILASRGAELIEELRQKQMRLQKELEVDILRNIKLKMEKIKANQRKIQGITKEPFLTHEIEGDEEGTSQQVPLVRGDSDASARGYHTPDSPASPRGFHTPISEASAPPSPHHSPPTTPRDSPSTSTPPADPSLAPLPAIPAPLSSHGGPPSPSSALLTSLSLDAYLEPRRISFGSPPSSELLPRAQSPEESYPVFSPPPIRRRHTVASPSLLQRTSIISQSSRSEPKSHQTSRRSDCPPYRTPKSHQHALRSGDYYMFDDFDDTELVVAKKNVLEEDADAPKGMGLGTLLSALIRADLKRTLAVRRATMPGPRQRRSSWRQVTSQPVSAHEEISVGPPFRRAASERGMGAGELPERGPPGEGSSGGRRPGEGPTNEEPTGEGAISSTSVEPIKETWFDKIMQVFDCVGAFISSSLISITRQLMKYSRDYRYVSRTLTYEKKLLKEREGFGIGIREGTQLRWEPIPESIGIVNIEESSGNNLLMPPVEMGRKLSDISVPEIRILAPSMERGLDASLAPSRCASPSPPHTPTPEEDDTSEHESAFTLQSTESKDISLLADNDDSMFTRQRWPIVLLAYAFWYAILAHTDIVCYLMVFINQIQSATILSIPLPLMVFLWGTLTIPRPTKTFWVTLIAYTEVIVLIKSMFQFEILPWNQKAIPVNMPFTAPRIIGIERKSNYALYDLLLLLIIFLHRFMLKSLGLWKESTPEVELREDMQFNLTPEDTNNLVEGNGTEVGQKYVKIHRQTGPSHRLVNHLRHVETAIEGVMRELKATRSDPRVVQRVNERLQLLRAAMRRKYAAKGRKPQASGSQALSTADLKVDEEDTASVDLPNTETDAAPGSSKPPDDEYYKVDDDKEPIIAVTTTLEAPYSRCPSILWLSLKRYIRPPQDFFKRMMQPMARVTADIYAYMFLCDFINFLIVIFGFAAFGTHQGDGGVQAYLEENKVPIPFLVMLILQFALIVIDRALYLRKFMLGKILFQYALIIGVHVWMFFILPFITERTFNTLAPPPLWYMVKCVYLLLSAYQIRCGYPCRIIGNFLCKSYNYVNMLAFRLFMAVPFVFELRTMMDWIWTDTSMALMDWLKMEDIFASLFLLKCGRYLEKEYPQDRGQKKAKTAKYILGGGVLTFIIAIIWFPLVFFAFGNRVGASNPPTDVTVKIRIGPYLPVYQMSAQSYNIQLFTQQEYAQLSNMYLRDRTAQTFLSNYMYDDLAVVTLNPNSTMMWAISPPEQDRLEREAKSNQTLVVKFTFVITHPSNNAQNPPTIEDSREVDLPALVYGKRDPERDILYNMLLNKSDPDTWLKVPTLFPKFLKVFNKGTAKPAFQLSTTNLDIVPTESYETTDKRKYRDVLMRLERDRGTMYWRVKEKCSSRDLLMAIPKNNCDMLVMYTFNDKLFPETLNFISGGGIIGLYTTFVFLASRVIRGFFSGIYTKIMFDDMPNVDRVLQLCLDIYLVREALELSLEEDLFAKLVFLYRSPETMIKWSRMKEDPDERQSQREAVQRAMPPDT